MCTCVRGKRESYVTPLDGKEGRKEGRMWRWGFCCSFDMMFSDSEGGIGAYRDKSFWMDWWVTQGCCYM
jgi:hypothetical protein